MNLTVTPVNYQTKAPQNISHKGFFNKLFKPKAKKVTKDVFVTSATAISAMGAVATTQAQKKEKNEEIENRIYLNIEKIQKFLTPQCNSTENRIKSINEDLKKLPQDSTTAFIEEVMICISNALKNNPNKLCSLYSNSGQVLGKEGRFLLITCKNLLELSSSEEYAKDKDFVEQVQKNVQLSKNLIQLINNGDWEKTKELDLGPILN